MSLDLWKKLKDVAFSYIWSASIKLNAQSASVQTFPDLFDLQYLEGIGALPLLIKAISNRHIVFLQI